jgi:ALG11 mannosyltransferase N-terminus
MTIIFHFVVSVLSLGIVVALLFIYLCRYYFNRLRKSHKRQSKKTVAFFHPYCSSGGGGERVLWKSIQALDELNCLGSYCEIIIYTVDPPDKNYTIRKFLSAILHWSS